MRPISLFTVEDAVAEFADENGLELSIKKWEAICEGLKKICNVTNVQCGLCMQYPTCQACPLPAVENWVCGDDKSSYTIAKDDMDKALTSAYNMLDVLKAIQKKEVLG